MLAKAGKGHGFSIFFRVKGMHRFTSVGLEISKCEARGWLVLFS